MPKLSELAPQVGTMRTIRKTFRKNHHGTSVTLNIISKNRDKRRNLPSRNHIQAKKMQNRKTCTLQKMPNNNNKQQKRQLSLTISYQNPSTFLSFFLISYLFSLRRSMKELGVSPVGIGVLGSSAYSGNVSAFCAFFVSILPGLRIPSFPTIGNS